MSESVCVWSIEREEEKENDERESSEAEDQIVRKGGRECRSKGSGKAYLPCLASSLPPPLVDAGRAGHSDDTLWRTSTLWPLSLR